ncbi:MAG: hydrogen peroxide-dependent heme synthase [Mycobacteriales bacterium]|nr:chlorite dismutase family protein [Frankia sp.]
MAESTKTARELNDELLYTMYAVSRARTDAARCAPADRGGATDEVEQLLDAALGKGVQTRGSYAVGGYRADADLMLWWTCPDPDALQETYTRFRQTRLGAATEPVWSAVGLHRPAEFNKGHIPAYVRQEEPRRYLCVYPFVRSLEWYLLEPDERRAMLAEHGQLARDYPDVRANTVSAFGLGDYEWLLAFEADELHRIVDLMRHLRAATARRHTKVEIPFYTGVRKPLREIVAALP